MLTIDKEIVAKEFGAFVRKAREDHGLYQADVAKLVGVSRGYYAHIEAGTREIYFTLALKLCHALKLNINDFVKLLK